ncbi:site-specific recombinase [Solitalea canadensis]|uniref:Site-specific recombinase n=1 Tax=Solitalea canadensis (strain ATCC 29591 / DSM 3403 / JCM 21819 / LMG 8368 / NBRC 15130 / NCIMB 12057 / USAM 9D) TaxID=929556 RepID=H8KL72_SOLCM|nr:site-specific recombinase [Solitalea canadensis]AFD09155.1 site-specific recombinase [Solitalea canadensis DSM 3403]
MHTLEESLHYIKQYPKEAGVDELVDLVDAIRPRKVSESASSQLALNKIIQLFKNNKELLDHFKLFIKRVVHSKNQIRLFTELGISANQSFFSELFRRFNEKILPATVDKDELLSVVVDVFHRSDDYIWIEAIDPKTWRELFELLGFETNKNKFVADEFYPSLYSSVQIIASRITSLGLEPEIIVRLPHIESYNSSFQAISYEVNKFVEEATTPDAEKETVIQHCKHIKVLLNQCRSAVEQVRRNQKKEGVSISLAYLLLRIDQNIERLLRILGSMMAEKKEERLTFSVQLFTGMVRYENQKRGIRRHIRANTEMLAYQVVEHTGQTGEHYITNTPKEYFHFLKQSMGGGLIISFTTWIKFLLHFKVAPLVQGLLYSLNYSLSFILIFVTHSTLATKQPSMTASALASALDDKKHQSIDLENTAELIVKLSRSQFVSFLGNLIIVIPLPYFIAWAYHYLTGQLIVNEATAIKTIQSIDPVNSLSVLYASITGMFLFVSGIINGYYDNMIHYGNVAERIRNYKLLQQYFSKEKLNKISLYVEKNFGGLMGNLFLGFFLGYAGVFGEITGLPFDIRHVTLAGGGFAMAFYTVGDYISVDTILSSLIGIFLIGLMNFLVSFSLSLFVALRSRKVNFSQTGALLNRVFAHFLAKPMDFFYPPRKRNLSLSPEESTSIHE